MAVTAAIVAGVGTAVSIDASRDAAEAQEEAIRASNAAETAKAAREKRQALREKRIKQAQVEQAAVNTGVAGSSGEFGAVGALSTNLATNLGFQGSLQMARDVRDEAMIKQTKAQLQGQLGSSLTNLGFTVFKGSGGFESLFGSAESDVESIFQPDTGLF